MKKLSFLVIVIAAALVGCGSPAAPEAVKNADGETEGKAPTFVSVPAQNDPAYKK